jgi:hypothetical protein
LPFLQNWVRNRGFRVVAWRQQNLVPADSDFFPRASRLSGWKKRITHFGSPASYLSLVASVGCGGGAGFGFRAKPDSEICQPVIIRRRAIWNFLLHSRRFPFGAQIQIPS